MIATRSRRPRTAGDTAWHSAASKRRWLWPAVGVAAGAVAALVVAVVVTRGGDDIATPSSGWESQGSGPSGGSELSQIRTNDFHSMVISPADPDLLLYGHHGGVLRSADGGRSWNKTNLAGKTDDAMGMGFAGVDGTSVFAAGHDTFFRSEDAGETWESLNPSLPGTDLHGLATAPDEPGTVYVHVVGFGILRSGDGGANWEKANQANLPRDIMSLSAGPRGRLYVASPGTGVFRSDDGGKSFALTAKVEVPLTVSVSASAPDIVYVGTQHGLFFSDDGGRRWQVRAVPSEGAVMVSAVNPSDPKDLTIVVVSQDGAGRVHRSTDSGVTWGSNE